MCIIYCRRNGLICKISYTRIFDFEWHSFSTDIEHLQLIFFYFFYFFSVRLLSVLRGHSFFSSSPQRPMTSDFEGLSIPDFIHYIYLPILILEKESVFPVLTFSTKQWNYWYHFYNVFGTTRSLAGDWSRDLPHSNPAL